MADGKDSMPVSSDSARLARRVVEIWRKLIAERADTSFHETIPGASLFPAVIDTVGFTIECAEKERLEFGLKAAFDIEPLEDGINHPAEQILEEALRSVDRSHILACLEALSVDAERPGFSASVLRCLSRLQPGTSAWRTGIVRAALGADDVEMRDAAVQAAESWGGAEIREVLRKHVEAVSWLRAYVEGVADDLEV
ncbi:MAG: hypothetical protein OXC69_08215 [Candidatus Tectomicrobia bacterium]|nr:hypothetical protein [Candidatus Tectomicrobia bacterium]